MPIAILLHSCVPTTGKLRVPNERLSVINCPSDGYHLSLSNTHRASPYIALVMSRPRSHKQRRNHSWTSDNDTNISHRRLIGCGGFAEVHEVHINYTSLIYRCLTILNIGYSRGSCIDIDCSALPEKLFVPCDMI